MPSKKEVYKSFYSFIGLLVSCEFTVVVLILSFEDISNVDYFSIFWLIISILCGLESMMGYLGYQQEKEKDVKNRKEEKMEIYKKKGKYFWYLTMYSFYISLTHFLLFKKLIHISLFPFYFLIYNIVFYWIDNLYIDVNKRKFKVFISISIIFLFIIYLWILGSTIYDRLYQILLVMEINLDLRVIYNILSSIIIIIILYKMCKNCFSGEKIVNRIKKILKKG